MQKRLLISGTAWLMLCNLVLFGTIAWILYADHAGRVRRTQACIAQCAYDYAKYTLHPKAGSYDLCTKGCEAQD